MSKVHTFPLVSDVYSDTRLPLQYPGNGSAAAPKQVELSMLLAWIEANITLPAGVVTVQPATITGGAPSVAITAGRLLSKIVVVSSGHDTFSLGTTPGGTELLDTAESSSAGEVYLLDRYFGSSGTIYFSGMSGTLTVKIILMNLT